jgi:hypothetical protein
MPVPGVFEMRGLLGGGAKSVSTTTEAVPAL